MGTNYRRTNSNFSAIGTTRLISLAASTVTRIAMTNSVASLVELVDLGPGTVAYGGTNITVSSAGLLFYSMGKIFSPVSSDFIFYVIADTETRISVSEYKA